MMDFSVTWYRSEEILSTERAESFFGALDVAESRLRAKSAVSRATRATVQADDGGLIFDSCEDMIYASKRAELAADLVRRFRHGVATAQAQN